MNNKIKILLVLILISIGALIFLVTPLTGYIIGFYKNPSPRIIDIKCEKFYSNSVPEIELIVSVKNFGGKGEITVIGEIDAAKNEYYDIQRKEIYMEEGETRNIIFYFDSGKVINAECFAKAFSS